MDSAEAGLQTCANTALERSSDGGDDNYIDSQAVLCDNCFAMTTVTKPETVPDSIDDQAMSNVRGLLEFIGEDPDREGLIKTPQRVINAMRDHFAGYHEDPKKFLERTFSEVEGYNELVVVSDIEIHSHCEHHMVPFVGKAHVAYIPDGTQT